MKGGQLRGADALRRRFRAISDVSPLFRQVQLDTVAGAKARVPVKTGFLRRSIVPGPFGDTGAIVYVNAPYAAAIEFGGEEYIIKPKQASVLAWPAAGHARLSGRPKKGTKSGDMIFAKRVKHPKTKAQPYLVPAAEEALRKVGIEPIIERWNKAG